jgi:hypothetical protein
MQFAGAGVEIEADAQNPAFHLRARVSPRNKDRLLDNVTFPEVEAVGRSAPPVLKTKGLEEGIGAAASAREQGPCAWTPGKSRVRPWKLCDRTGSLKPARAVSSLSSGFRGDGGRRPSRRRTPPSTAKDASG